VGRRTIAVIASLMPMRSRSLQDIAGTRVILPNHPDYLERLFHLSLIKRIKIKSLARATPEDRTRGRSRSFAVPFEKGFELRDDRNRRFGTIVLW
jgi:hypothetical protein